MTEIITPISPEYQKLLRDNQELSGLKDFFADYINNILLEEKKKFVEKKDFELFEGYLENLKEYQKVLEEKDIEIKDIGLIEKLVGGQSIEEFKKLLEEENITDLLLYTDKGNLLELFNSKGFTIEKCKEIVKDDPTVDFIRNVDRFVLTELFKLNGFTTKDLKEIVRNESIMDFMMYVEKIVLVELFKLNGLTTKDLKFTEEILENNSNFDNSIINVLWILYNIKTIKDLEKIKKNDDFKEWYEYLSSKERFREEFIEYKKNIEQNVEQKLILINFLSYYANKAIEKKGLKEFSKKERDENIKKVNNFQEEELKELDFEDKDFYLEKSKENRDLVLYYRGAMSRFEFLLIAKILREYVGKYSKIFNNIKVVPRLEKGWDMNDIPDNLFKLGNFERINGRGKDFLKATNIYANTIHFVNGTPNEKIFSKTTIHIASKYITDIRLSGNEEKLNLEYGNSDNVFNRNSGKTLSEISNEVLRAVIRVEERMLEDLNLQK